MHDLCVERQRARWCEWLPLGRVWGIGGRTIEKYPALGHAARRLSPCYTTRLDELIEAGAW
jgi:hypothetical protein